MTLLIGKSDFANKVQISDYETTEVLNIAINDAQQLYLRPIIGDTLFNQLVAGYPPPYGDSDLQGLYVLAVDLLVYRAGVNYYSRTNIQDTQSGLRTKNDEFSSALTPQELAIIIRQTETMAKQAEAALIDYMRATYSATYTPPAKSDTMNISGIGASNKDRFKFGVGDKKWGVKKARW